MAEAARAPGVESSGRQDMQKLQQRIQLSPLFSMLEMLAKLRRDIP